jgi:hypothetical protein
MPLNFYASDKMDWDPFLKGGCMLDNALQECFIHFLYTKSCQIDEWDGGIIPCEEIREFKINVKKAISAISQDGENLNFSPNNLEEYYRRTASYGLKALPPRDQVVADLTRLMEVVNEEETNNLNLYFHGD